MQAGQPETQQRQMPILVYKHTILQGGTIAVSGDASSKKSSDADGHATTLL